MDSTIRRGVDWMRRRAENVVAALLGIMFVCFLIQIVFRYFFNFPIGWTSELSVVMWLYMTLLGSTFWLKESDEVRFDLISGSLGPMGRRVLGLAVAVATVILFGMVIVRYAWAIVTVLRGEAPEAGDVTSTSSGL